MLVPWEIYREYGDIAAARRAVADDGALAGLRRADAAGQRHPARVERPAEPLPHERYLWDTGFHWGEWLVPGEDPSDFRRFVAADKSDVATAYFAWSTRSRPDRAGCSAATSEAARYAALSAAAVDAWRAEFLDADGRVTPETQANLVRALAFGLVPDEHCGARRPTAWPNWSATTATHLAHRLPGHPDLLPVLADAGHLDVAYELLFQDTEPSWLTMIDRGATTVWERWEGVDDDGVPHESLNHYSKGAVIWFLHRYVAGLRRLEPAYRRFRVEPRPGGGLTWAPTAHDSPHGRVAASWRWPTLFELSVTVPPGCTAEVVLPSGAPRPARARTSSESTEAMHRRLEPASRCPPGTR